MLEIERAIKQFVLDNFVFGGSIDDISDTASFIETGVIDSLGVLELISFTEDTFGIVVDDEDVLPENFDSVRNLATYTSRKLTTAPVLAG